MAFKIRNCAYRMHFSRVLFWLFILHYAGATSYLKWPTRYYYKATMNIPSANISQPYEVWANGVTGNLRFDFYSGMCKIYKKKRGNNATEPFRYYWVGPESTSIHPNNTVCRQLSNKSREVNLITNTYLQPLRFNLKETGKDVNKTTKWEFQFKGVYGAIYHFAVWTTESRIGRVPVRYEYRMLYKDAELDFRQQIYEKFIIAKPDPAVFKIVSCVMVADGLVKQKKRVVTGDVGKMCETLDNKDLRCKAFSANHIDENETIIHLEDPILEYNMTEEFERFKSAHSKKYKTEHEHFMRYNVFKTKFRYIQYMNRQQKSYKLAVNHLTDLTDDELSALLGTKVKPETTDLTDFENDYEGSGNFDWRWFNASSPVKDQTSLCGSCYAFATAAAVESAAYISKGCHDMEEASEQALIDCSRGKDRNGNDGCNGGFLYNSLKWIINNGIPLRSDYGPYLGMEGYCNLNQSRFLHISGYEKLPKQVKSIKQALRNHGPLAATINVPMSLFYYASGVYDDKSCSSDPKNMTHAILIVGYGKENGKKYWLIKNSYGSNWGDGGYFKLDMQDNLCGVANSAYAVINENSRVNQCKRN